MIKSAFLYLVIALVLVGGGYRWGAKASDNSHAAEQLKTEREEFSQFKREVQRGQAASVNYQGAHAALTSNYKQLQEAFNAYKKRSSILVRTPANDATQSQCAEQAAAPESGLSAGAVWMWNSALQGADKPVGACGLADQSEGACAVDTGLRLQDAWDNQAENARLCAEDRQRHKHLIDYILKGQKHAD
ncbi:MAG: hypothetical protein Q7K57_49350 [Burkholderiaceae bacterium]|nr:hypothetical protein [Burkholderiaceae bacterium]